MIEKEMGYRGSKSELGSKYNSVKEQRVDGSWHFLANQKKKCLRCTLMGFERNYQVKILSKQINKSRTYCSIATHKPLLETFSMNPWFLLLR